MQIRKASFKKLHGYIDQDLTFKPGVNVLIGTNGSGKTTILNALAWTLSPASIRDGISAAYLLSTLEFEEIDIAFTVKGTRKYQHVRAKPSKDGESLEITISGASGGLRIPIVQSSDNSPAPNRGIAEPEEIVARHMDDERNNPVLQRLSELPGPLYLPLDRRWLEPTEVPRRLPRYRRTSFAGYLPIGNVLALAERAHRREQFALSELNADLRQKLLASLFESGYSERIDRVWTASEVSEKRQRIVSALISLGVEGADKVTKSYFERLETISNTLGGQTFTNLEPNDPNRDLWLEWIIEVSPLASRAESLLNFIGRNEMVPKFRTDG